MDAPEAGGYAGAMTSPAIWRKAGRNFLIYVGMWGLYCVDSKTGSVVWRESGPNAGVDYASSPAISGDIAVITAWREVRGYRLTRGGPRLLWHAPFLDSYSSPVADNGCVYTIGKNQPGSSPMASC